MVHGESFSLSTKGFSDIKDVTGRVESVVSKSGIKDGLVCVAAVGSTASVSTIEHEPALNQDFQDQLEKLASQNMHSRHSQTWGDDNGFSHIRATFMGPSLAVPVAGGSPVLGTWQQVVVIDHDNRPRNRKVFVQVIGE
ncbi:MAG: YjbQ family protein [Chitinivibrionales bacterium]|nr:YjbQ family protein [Chitinivibrionales bacterium]MBD3396808.1 YjbQ family protein [Chitinivibrionales bacterium]